MSKVNIPTVRLNNGTHIPVLGFGTWFGFDDQLNFDISDAPKLMDALSYAIDLGYRHVDTAHFYRIEPEVGKVVKKKIEEGVVKREDIFITTKVWQSFHREADVEKAVRASLRRLDLEYLDLVLIHFPMSISEDGVDEKIDYLETWRGCEGVLRRGLTRSIGVSNFNSDQIRRLLNHCSIKPVCNQIEVNLHLAQPELVQLCQDHEIAVEAYSPFGTMSAGRVVHGPQGITFHHPDLVAIGNKHGKTVPQVILRHLYQRGLVVITKTMTKSRVLENASIFDFELDENEVEQLSRFDIGHRFLVCPFFQDYDNYPFEKVPGEKVPIPQTILKWKNGINLDVD